MVFPDVGNTILLETNVPGVHRQAFTTSRRDIPYFRPAPGVFFYTQRLVECYVAGTLLCNN